MGNSVFCMGVYVSHKVRGWGGGKGVRGDRAGYLYYSLKKPLIKLSRLT